MVVEGSEYSNQRFYIDFDSIHRSDRTIWHVGLLHYLQNFSFQSSFRSWKKSILLRMYPYQAALLIRRFRSVTSQNILTLYLSQSGVPLLIHLYIGYCPSYRIIELSWFIHHRRLATRCFFYGCDRIHQGVTKKQIITYDITARGIWDFITTARTLITSWESTMAIVL